MVSSRLRHSHRIRRASGPSRPANQPEPSNLTLAEFFSTYDPELEELPLHSCTQLRWRSAPRDDILEHEDIPDPAADQDLTESETSSIPDGSLQVNLLSKKLPAPTHHVPFTVPVIPSHSELKQQADQWTSDLIRNGANIPPPFTGPRVFQATPPSPLMDRVIHDLLQNRIIRKQRIVNAFLCFLISKPTGAARFIMYISPWTPFYKTPHMPLYSAADVLAAIRGACYPKVRGI
jgi:hypothetical protein